MRNASPARPVRMAAAALALALVAVACGGDDDASGSTTADTTTPAADTTAAGTDTTAGGADTTAGSPTAGTDGGAGDASAFPVTIEHKYGETTIDALPERIVVIGFAEHEALLALGVAPVGVREWYGEFPYATWPWAQDELAALGATPEVLPADQLNFEQIVTLDPDLILGISSGMTDTDYATLSAIAPTVAQSAEYVEWGEPWDAILLAHGQATGRAERAEQLVAEIKGKFEAVKQGHPEWDGLTAGVTYIYDGQPGGYASGDNRPVQLAMMGLATPPLYDEIAGDVSWFTVSPEETAKLDADALLWVGLDTPDAVEQIKNLALRPSLTAFAEGREVVLDSELAGAFSHASPLAFDYVLDNLVPLLEAALDGDPATPVPGVDVIAP